MRAILIAITLAAAAPALLMDTYAAQEDFDRAAARSRPVADAGASTLPFGLCDGMRAARLVFKPAK